jgi:hypothetical protein
MYLNVILFLPFFLIGPGPLPLLFLAAQPKLAFSSPPAWPSWPGHFFSLSPRMAQPAGFFPFFLRAAQFPSRPKPAAPLSPFPPPLASRWVPPVRTFSFPEPGLDSSPSSAGTRCHPRLARSLLCRSAAPHCRASAPEAPCSGEGSRQRLLPLSPSFPCAQIARCRPKPHLTTDSHLRPPSPLPEPLDALLASLSCSQAKPEPKPYQETCLRVISASRRRPPPLPLTTAPCRRPLLAIRS